ncbi:MAG: DUF59 domain-containing protein [Sandaracinaceae bacterium]|nr:DUF59 domain-containing protein [Sandaracinaceae bacterium]
MPNDIEHLKVHKIHRPDEVVRREQGRVSLGVLGQVDNPPDITEARGGSGEVAEVVDEATLREAIVATLQGIHDPEIPVNIYDLGLIYGFTIDDAQNVEIEMTLTAPGCPVAGMLVEQVAAKVGAVPGVRTSRVELTWDPPWTKDRMSEEAMLELGLL